MEKRFEAVGDLAAPDEVKNVTDIYKVYAKLGIKEDEKIVLNWRVIAKDTGRTLAIFGGGAGYDAACVFADYCEGNY